MRSPVPSSTFVRVTVVLTCLAGIASVTAYRRARAATDTALLSIGDTLSKSFSSPHAPARRLRLNGNTVTFATHTVDLPVGRVIEAYERHCEDRDAYLSETLTDVLWNQVAETDRAPLRLASVTVDSHLEGSRGYVACLELGAAAISLDDLVLRFRRFADTGNLGQLGTARYVYATSLAGESGRSFVLEVSATALDLRSLLNPDPRYVERSGAVPPPAGAKPILHAEELDAPSSVSVFSIFAPLDSVQAHYEHSLTSSGWRLVGTQPTGTRKATYRRVAIALRATQVVLVFGSQSATGATTFTVLRTEAE